MNNMLQARTVNHWFESSQAHPPAQSASASARADVAEDDPHGEAAEPDRIGYFFRGFVICFTVSAMFWACVIWRIHAQ